jgi:hypothetical protein
MIDPNTIANLHNYITISPQLAIVGERLQLKRLVPMAVDRAIVEIISPVVDRSVTIACMTAQARAGRRQPAARGGPARRVGTAGPDGWPRRRELAAARPLCCGRLTAVRAAPPPPPPCEAQELVLKDHALEPEGEALRRSAHLMVTGLAQSLALVTAKEPLRIAVASNLRALLANQLDANMLEQVGGWVGCLWVGGVRGGGCYLLHRPGQPGRMPRCCLLSPCGPPLPRTPSCAPPLPPASCYRWWPCLWPTTWTCAAR